MSGSEVARFYENYLSEVGSVPYEAAEREYLASSPRGFERRSAPSGVLRWAGASYTLVAETPGRLHRRRPARVEPLRIRKQRRVTRTRTLGAAGAFVAAVCTSACVFADLCLVPFCC